MNSHCTRGLSILGLLLAMSARTQANDIVDFLRAVNGVPEERHPASPHHLAGRHDHGTGRHDGAGYGGRELSSRDVYKQSLQADERHAAFGEHGRIEYGNDRFDRKSYDRNSYDRDRLGRSQSDFYNRVDLRDRSYSGSHPSHSNFSRPRVQISLRVGSNTGVSSGSGGHIHMPPQQSRNLASVQTLPPVQDYPPVHDYPPVQSYPPVQDYPPVQVLPHEIGQIVDCQVPLATRVLVEDECNIAPDAVPAVIAVRDPSMCAHESHERLVYVQVFVPPCPLRSLTVSPCRTGIRMDFCDYGVDIKSKNGVIIVDYDN